MVSTIKASHNDIAIELTNGYDSADNFIKTFKEGCNIIAEMYLTMRESSESGVRVDAGIIPDAADIARLRWHMREIAYALERYKNAGIYIIEDK